MNKSLLATYAIIIILVLGVAIFVLAPPNSRATAVSVLSSGQLMLTGQCAACSYGASESYTAAQQEQDISMLKGLGFTSIRIDLGYNAWLTNNQTWINKESLVISYVKALGLSLVIADASAGLYRNHELGWMQFKEAWVQRVQTIASMYHPNYYLVIKEPGWYVPMVSDARTNPQFQSAADWDNLSSWLANTVSSVSPQTTVGVTIAVSGLETQPNLYAPFLMNLPSQISILGLDTYGASDNQVMQTFLQTYGNLGRTIWNAETWSQPLPDSNPQTDPLWIASQYNLCVSLGISEMNPFYSNDFVQYGQDPTSFVASTPVALMMQYIAHVNA